MAATDPQSLLNPNDVSCYSCYNQPTLFKLALLRQILLALNPMASTSPQALLNNSDVQCYNCDYSQAWLLELALLRQIAIGIGGGSGSGGQISSGVGQPVADPGVANAVYTDTATGNQFWFYNGAWH